MTVISVPLPPEAREMAQAIGIARNATNRAGGQSDGKVDPGASSVEVDKLGAIGEYALAVLLQLPWSGAYFEHGVWAAGARKATDVSGVDVRATPRADGNLICQKWDDDWRPYVLARVFDEEVHLVGWTLGKVGKSYSYWRVTGMPRPCFLVPARDLWPMESIFGFLQHWSPRQV